MGDERPTYLRIADDLRVQIAAGQLPPGSLLPSQTELSERYGVARMTARQALSQLVNDGLVTTRQGKGAIVRTQRRMVYRPQSEFRPRTSRVMDRFMSELLEEGRDPSQRIEVAVVEASEPIARRLGLTPASPVVARRRVRFIDDEPFNINDTFYDYELAKNTEIMSPADIARGSNFVIADLGYPEVRAIDEFYVRMPTPEEVARLNLSPGTPVAVHYVTGYTADEHPTRCDVFVLPGDRHVILYERIHPANADDMSNAPDRDAPDDPADLIEPERVSVDPGEIDDTE